MDSNTLHHEKVQHEWSPPRSTAAVIIAIPGTEVQTAQEEVARLETAAQAAPTPEAKKAYEAKKAEVRGAGATDNSSYSYS